MTLEFRSFVDPFEVAFWDPQFGFDLRGWLPRLILAFLFVLWFCWLDGCWGFNHKPFYPCRFLGLKSAIPCWCFPTGSCSVTRARGFNLSVKRFRSCFACGFRIPLPYWVVLCLAFPCRVGEAAVPGPLSVDSACPSQASQPFRWQLGVCNPAGFPTKAHLIAHSPVDVWLAAETHLTVQGHRDFVRNLHLEGSDYKWCVMGCPVPPRSLASPVGSWNGVAILSKHPTRKMQHVWDRSLLDTGRLLCTTSFVHDFWLTGVVVYGLPTGGTHPNARATTVALLEHAVRCISQMDGPRFLGGDFNQDLCDLPCIDQLKALHFVEIQDLFFAKTGVLPRPTCKRKTQRDFLYISSDLIPLFEHLELDYDQWVDHAALIATFKGSGQDLRKFLWPKPLPLPWTSVRSLPSRPPCQFSATACTEDYRTFWQHVEEDVASAVRDRRGTFCDKCKGRARRLQPLVCPGSAKPVGPGRAGELHPHHFGISFLHKHWFRQLRRLQSLVRICGAITWTSAHSEHRASLWNSVLRAPRFKPDFRTWWTSRSGAVGDPLEVPLLPPSHHLAVALFQAFETDVRDLEARLNASRKKRLPGSGSALRSLFQEVKRDAPLPVDVLVDSKVGRVAEIDHADVAVVLDPPVKFRLDCPLLLNGKQLTTHMITEDKLYLDSVESICGTMFFKP